MGTIEKGYLGGFKGILGTAVGSKWKGKSVVKSRPPRKRTKPSTQPQLEQQAKFALIIAFLKPIRTLLNLTYKKSAAADMSGHNMAFSKNKDAVAGVFPDFAIDYAKVLLSEGSLLNADAPAAASTAAGKLVFTWTDNSDGENELISDMVFVAAYNEEKKTLDTKTTGCRAKCGNLYFGRSNIQRETGTNLYRVYVGRPQKNFRQSVYGRCEYFITSHFPGFSGSGPCRDGPVF